MNPTRNPNQDHQEQPQNDLSEVKRVHIEKNVESSVRQARRTRFMRMLVIPILFIIPFIFLVVLGHDLFVKKEYIKNMHKINRQIDKFVRTNNRLPSRESFLQFEIKSRNLRIDRVHYDDTLIMEDSPPETVLAHTDRYDFWLLDRGHAVLYRNGEVEWVCPETLEDQLQKRRQFYNSGIMQNRP